MGSRVRVEQRISKERAPGYEIANVPAGPFAGGAGPTPPVAPGSRGGVSITLRPTVGDVLTNVGGNPATLLDLSTLNSAFQGLAWSFPAGTGDDNREEWCNQPVPIGLSSSPNLRARVHFIIVS